MLDFEYMAKNVRTMWGKVFPFMRNHSMHAKELMFVVGKGSRMRMGGGSDNIGDFGGFLGKVSGKVHFFPPIFFFPLNSWKPKLRPKSRTFYKIYNSI
jgi:hypothetical protein